GMALEQPADALDLGGVAADDRVRVPDRDPYELDAFDDLGRPHLDAPELLLDLAVAHTRPHGARADADRNLSASRPLGEPASRDPGAVSGHLGLRPIRVPDRDLGLTP